MAENISTQAATKHNVHHIDGLPLPPFITSSQIESIKGMTLFPDDVWIVTYPKSGTTWMQQIVRKILARGDETKKIDEAVPWPESKFGDHNIDFTCLKRPRAFKSHMPYHRMPCGLPSETPCKYIYVVRNPKDVAVSYFYHYFTLKEAENFDWDTFISWFLSGEVLCGSYFDHVLSWWKHAKDENVLIMKFEDMKKDLRSSVVKIASFLNINHSENEIDLITERSTFMSMKKDPTANYEWIPPDRLHPKGTPFLRKGNVGDWKEHFSPELSAKFDALYKEKLKPVGLDLDFE